MALDVDPVAISGEWIRHAPHRSDLLGRSTEPTDGRWQRGDADLSTIERLAAVDLPRPRPRRRDWPPYQDIGQALWHDGWRGVLAPSAARPKAQAICVFCDNWPPGTGESG